MIIPGLWYKIGSGTLAMSYRRFSEVQKRSLFQHTRIWKELSKILKRLTGSEQFVCSAMFTLAYRLDFKPVSKTGEPG